MFDIFFDCESNGLNPYTSEVIEGFFIQYEGEKIIDTYHLKSQVNEWSYEAEEIHKITYSKMKTYPKKHEAFRRLLAWLPRDFRFITYVNKNTVLGTINFDVAILLNELDLLGYGFYYLKNNFQMKDPISVHPLAKEVLKGRIKKFSQSNVYQHLFNETYDAHDAKADTHALARIYFKLIELSHEDNDILRLN